MKVPASYCRLRHPLSSQAQHPPSVNPLSVSFSLAMVTRAATGVWLTLIALIPVIAAQTEANCTDSQYSWMFNSLGLSPCHVAEQLVQPCNPEGFIIPPLPGGDEYFGPSTIQNNSCICTSVYYSLLSACGACQDDTWVTWTRFTRNCSVAYLMDYPNPIPTGVNVPHWAYLDVSNGNTFSPYAAKNAAGPESTSPAGSTSISVSPTSTLSIQPSSSSSSSPSSPSSSAGPIAAGVVGGVVFVAVIAAVAIFFYRRRERRHSPNQAKNLTTGPDVLSTTPITWAAPTPLLPTLRPQKPYDSKDPTTFPTTPHANSDVFQSLTGTTYNTTRHGPTLSGPQYTGAAEVY